jgi:hypothetical protein
MLSTARTFGFVRPKTTNLIDCVRLDLSCHTKEKNARGET